MSPHWNELPISLENLDDHLKALLRLKIREFVHLSPWFKDLSHVEPSAVMTQAPTPGIANFRFADSNECPHRKPGTPVGRRHVRAVAHLSRSF